MLKKECSDIHNYYNILDLEYTANTETIRKQYHKSARQWHPDRNNGDDVKFKKIKEAYDVLIDPHKKKMYDLNVTPSEKSLNHQESTTFFYSDMNFEFDFNDIIGNIFGNMREHEETPNIHSFSQNKPFNVPRRKKEEKNPEDMEIILSIDDVLNGSDKDISYEKETNCDTCKGEGVTYTSLLQCLSCNGRGYIEAFPCPYVCISCNGDAHIKMNLKKCTLCENGTYFLKKTERIHIDSGHPNGTQLSFKHLRIKLKHSFIENKCVRIDKKGVHIKHFIKIEELFCGFKHIINISESKNNETEICLERDGYFDFNEIVLIQNKGYVCPQQKSRSHVYIRILLDSKTKNETNIRKYKRVFEKIFSNNLGEP